MAKKEVEAHMNSKPELEKRIYSFEIRADEQNGEGILTGRPIVYGSTTDMGWFDEVIDTGALDGADLKDVRFLVNHDTAMIPLARSRRNNGNSTMQFSIDNQGMLLDWVKLDIENNSDARSLFSAVKRGDITGMSFMFGVKRDEWDNLESEHPLRRIKEISAVVEVSAVTFPAYEATDIQARSKITLENAKKTVETARSARAESVETDLELLKEKTRTLMLKGAI